MRVLFITSDYPANSSNIYTDLAKEINKNHSIKVVVATEKKNIIKTELLEESGISVLRIKTGNLYEIGLVEKAITFLTISNDLIKGIKQYFANEKFDLILFQAPPVTFNKVIKWAMKKYNCHSYLMQKDIFPQNGVDLGLFTKKSPIYMYFKVQEQKLYKTATKIGCMTKGNIDYLKKNNPSLKDKFELFPNTAKVKKKEELSKSERKEIRSKYGFKEDDVIAIFGGNFGKPQGLDFLIKVIDDYKNNSKIKFLLIGKGTEKNKVFEAVANSPNVSTFDFLPRDDYNKLLLASDIGLIFLDPRFTIPNCPSKTLSYWENSLPIMAAIDPITDYGDLLETTSSGFSVISGNIKDYCEKFDKLINDSKFRNTMGKNGRTYYEQKCDVSNSVKILMKMKEGN